MILTKKVNIKMNGKHVSKYREMGYDCKPGDIIEVDIYHVPINSHILIDVECDFCKNVKKIKYQVYNKNISDNRYYACSIKCSLNKSKETSLNNYGCENPMQNTNIVNHLKSVFLKKYGVTNPNKNIDTRNKIKETNLSKYGVINVFQSEEIKKNIKSNNLIKYGVEYIAQCDIIKGKMKKTRILNGHQISEHLLTDFKIYRKNVNRLTNSIRDKVKENWNGYDYYDYEYIIDNFNLDPKNKNYPHLDHKISVYNGFINNIPIEKIASIENICITKGYINSKKCKLDESEFIKIINNNELHKII